MRFLAGQTSALPARFEVGSYYVLFVLRRAACEGSVTALLIITTVRRPAINSQATRNLVETESAEI